MSLTRDFKITMRERAQRDPNFRQAMLIEAVNALLADDIEHCKINA